MSKMKVDETINKAVEVGLAYSKSKYTGLEKIDWKAIRSGINISEYRNSVAAFLETNFDCDELHLIATEHGTYESISRLKHGLELKLYDLGKAIGSDIGLLIIREALRRQ